jgi:hypothetical protein
MPQARFQGFSCDCSRKDGILGKTKRKCPTWEATPTLPTTNQHRLALGSPPDHWKEDINDVQYYVMDFYTTLLPQYLLGHPKEIVDKFEGRHGGVEGCL